MPNYARLILTRAQVANVAARVGKKVRRNEQEPYSPIDKEAHGAKGATSERDAKDAIEFDYLFSY